MFKICIFYTNFGTCAEFMCIYNFRKYYNDNFLTSAETITDVQDVTDTP